MLCAGGKCTPLSDGMATHIHTNFTIDHERDTLRPDAISDWCSESSIRNGKYATMNAPETFYSE